jgi:hypothetical protein
MLEELIVFFIILLLSLSAKNLISFKSKDKLGIVYHILLRLRYVGVAVHEVSHYIMSLAVGKVPRRIEIKWKDEKGFRNPHGHIYVTPPSFLQAVVTCLAPLYISTWFIFFSLQTLINPIFNPVVRIIAALFCISLFLGAAPSSGDFGYMISRFKDSPLNSLYQIFLIFISGILLWIILSITRVVFILDFYYYIAIAGLYLTLKLSILGVVSVFSMIRSRDYKKPEKVKMNRFTRKQYKPKKPKVEW